MRGDPKAKGGHGCQLGSEKSQRGLFLLDVFFIYIGKGGFEERENIQ
jgi:hypothetical protein